MLGVLQRGLIPLAGVAGMHVVGYILLHTVPEELLTHAVVHTFLAWVAWELVVVMQLQDFRHEGLRQEHSCEVLLGVFVPQDFVMED